MLVGCLRRPNLKPIAPRRRAPTAALRTEPARPGQSLLAARGLPLPAGLGGGGGGRGPGGPGEIGGAPLGVRWSRDAVGSSRHAESLLETSQLR